jgi:hypothetical protein
MTSSSSDLMLLLLVTSFGAKPYPLALVPSRRSPSSLAAHRLGPTVEPHDPGAQPLPNGATKWVNRWSIRLPHGLFRSGGVLESEGPASLEGSADDGGVARDGVDGVVAVRDASSPWDQPSGPMEIRAIWRIANAPTGPVTTVMWRASSSSSSPSSSSPLTAG